MFARLALRGSNGPLLIAMGAFATVALSLSVFEFHPVSDAAKAPAPVPITTVVVTSHAIARGDVVGQQDLGEKRIEGVVPGGAALSASSVLGHVAARDLRAGETMTASDVTDASTVGIAVRVPDGQRAFAIRVMEEDIVGGFLQSGDHVDVFATIPGTVFPAKNASDVPDRSETILLLQNVVVLAVGENLSTKGSVQSNARTVSVALTPEQLAKLALAQRFGKLSLAIRNPGDATVVADERATLADITPGAAPSSTQNASRQSAGHRSHLSGVPFYAGTHKTIAPWSSVP